ncbi:hypothetical protein T4B_13678, partial [Trichinella pseudospiralis]
LRINSISIVISVVEIVHMDITYKRIKSTVGCSVRISSLFMVALGAGCGPHLHRYALKHFMR